MSDVEVSFGAVDKGVAEAVRKLNQSLGAVAEKQESKFKESFGGVTQHILKAMGVMKLAHTEVHLLKEAVHEFAKADDAAAASLANMNREMERLNQSIGRDVFSAIFGPDAQGFVTDFVELVLSAQNMVANLFVPGEELRAQAEAKEAVARQNEEWKKQVALRTRLKELQVGIDEASGSDLQAKLGREDARFAEDVEKNRKLGAHGEDAMKLDSMTKATHQANIERIIEEERKKQESEARTARDKKTRDDEEHARAVDKRTRALEELDLSEKQGRIENLRMQGKQKEADLLQLALQRQKELAAIARNEALTSDEKERAARRVNDLFDERKSLVEAEEEKSQKKEDRSRSLGAGLFSRDLGQQVFGPGGQSQRGPERDGKKTAEGVDKLNRQMDNLNRIQGKMLEVLLA